MLFQLSVCSKVGIVNGTTADEGEFPYMVTTQLQKLYLLGFDLNEVCIGGAAGRPKQLPVWWVYNWK